MGVQASGQISVRALVRGPHSAQGLAHSRPGGRSVQQHRLTGPFKHSLLRAHSRLLMAQAAEGVAKEFTELVTTFRSHGAFGPR